LTVAAAQTVSLVRERVRVPKVGTKQLVLDLGNDNFAVRERASKELEKLGKAAEVALRQALAVQPELEVRRRVEALLKKLERGSPHEESLREVRALQVLGHIGTREAQQLLKAFAMGPSESPLTQEAKAALDRLKRAPSTRAAD
jgi:HEAT repeat protein